jgi:hypothetical protein
MGTGKATPLVPVCSPHTEADLQRVRLLLDAAGVPFVVENEHYSAAVSGAALPRLGDASLRVLVPGDRAAEARSLLGPVVR